MNARKFTILAAAILLLPLAALAEGRFKGFEFTVEGTVSDMIAEDLNNDGLDDIVILHINKNTRPTKRLLTVFFQDKDAGFSSSKKVEWKAPPMVAAVDVGDVSSDPGNELVFITENGISYATVSESSVSGLKELFDTQTVIATAYLQKVPYYNFVRDFTGDGRDDVLISGFTSARVARGEANYNFVMNEIDLKPAMEVDSWDRQLQTSEKDDNPRFRVSYFVPQVYTADFNADGKPDLVASLSEQVMIFEQGPEGFSRRVSKDYLIKLLPKAKIARGQDDPTLVFEDIDGDGKMDILASQVTGTIGKLKSRTVLFLGKTGSAERGKPDIEFKTDAECFGAYVRDVNNDGRLDVILPTFEIGALNAGKVLLTGDIAVKWAYFLQKDNGSFDDEPDRHITTNLKFSLTKFKLESGIPNVFADFNGDELPDQALGEDDTTMVITLRDAEGNAIDPVEKIEAPVSVLNRAVDLNHDNLYDLVMIYPEDPDHSNEVRIFLNTGPWTED